MHVNDGETLIIIKKDYERRQDFIANNFIITYQNTLIISLAYRPRETII